ncbi:MAG: hypothetical protein AB8G15_05585 [Saprospiraceae bacterium]
MKRRSFLTATGTVGIASIVSGSTVASSVFSSINTNVLLEDFNDQSKTVLNEFMKDIVLNTKDLGLDADLAKNIVMPVLLLKNNTSGKNQNITYKNKFGDIVSLSTYKGKQQIKISKAA